jgi:hypothetical protein
MAPPSWLVRSEIEQDAALELGHETRVGELLPRRPERAVQERLVHQPERELGREIRGDVGIVVPDVRAAQEHEDGEASDHLVAELAAAAEELRILRRA